MDSSGRALIPALGCQCLVTRGTEFPDWKGRFSHLHTTPVIRTQLQKREELSELNFSGTSVQRSEGSFTDRFLFHRRDRARTSPSSLSQVTNSARECQKRPVGLRQTVACSAHSVLKAYILVENPQFQAREMPQQLRVFVALSEDLCSISSTHVAPYNCL